jgi:F0F1-type ATP synthase delta subunit
VREIMEKRRGVITQKVQDAEHARSEAQALKDRYQVEMNELKDQKSRMLEEMQEEVQEARKTLIGKAREDSDRIAAREKAVLNAEKHTIEAEIKEKVFDSVSVYSSNLLKGIADETLHKAIFRQFIDGLQNRMPEHAVATGNEETLTIQLATAYPLQNEDVERVKDIVQSRSGRKTAVAVTIDAALIAGVRMKAGDQVVDSSLAGQIQALKERLKETA